MDVEEGGDARRPNEGGVEEDGVRRTWPTDEWPSDTTTGVADVDTEVAARDSRASDMA